MPEETEDLGQGLVMRAVRDERDAERYVSLSSAINGEHEGVMCARLIHDHPETSYRDYVLVEDTQRDGAIVSTTCLIPWHLNFASIVLEAAMLEMVVTHPDYRRRGLVRAQIQRFHRAVSARGFDLSIIQGIPNYYRQFGYAYALDHQPHDSLPVWRIPSTPKDTDNPYKLRDATLDDVPVLAHLYQQASAAHDVYMLRSPEYWRFLLDAAHYPVRLVEDMRYKGRSAGYIITFALPDQSGIDVSESGILGYKAAMAVLYQLKSETKGDIRLGGSRSRHLPNNTLLRAEHSLGSTTLPCDQWLLRIPNIAAFISKTGAILEQRLATSDCAGASADICINLYRDAYVLHFEQGKLTGVDAPGFVDASMGADGGDLCIPSDAFVRLVVGYRTLDELHDAWPDIVVKPRSRHLLDVLFPRMASCAWMPY